MYNGAMETQHEFQTGGHRILSDGEKFHHAIDNALYEGTEYNAYVAWKGELNGSVHFFGRHRDCGGHDNWETLHERSFRGIRS